MTYEDSAVAEFMQDLPDKLRMELADVIYNSYSRKIFFLAKMDNSYFNSWVCPMLTVKISTDDTYL